MLMGSPSVRIFISTQPVDMRKSFDGLAAATRFLLDHDPMSGHLFVFFNRRADLMKAIWWSGGGWSLLAKRLERGKFRFIKPVERGAPRIEVTQTELAMILDGIDLRRARQRKRWNPGLRTAAG